MTNFNMAIGGRQRMAVAAECVRRGSMDITPDKSLIRKLGSTGYRTYEALSELVDNSIDARGEGGVKVQIGLDYAAQSITVDDDGVGMDLDELCGAMTLGKEPAGRVAGRLGVFGLGMKTACSFLGRSFSVSTSRSGSSEEYAAEYDEGHWEGLGSIGWKSFPYTVRTAEPPYHGTRIAVTGLRVPLYPAQTTLFKRRIGERYGEYMRQGHADIRINRVQCEAVSPDMADGSVRRFTLETSAGPVPAWIGLLRRRSVVGSYGIDLYYRDRLIKMHSRFGIRDHPSVAKIVGRVSLNHVPLNFYKTGFITDSAEYAEAEQAFRAHPAVVDTARGLGGGSRRAGAGEAALRQVYDYMLGRRDEPGGEAAASLGRAASASLLDSLPPLRAEQGGRSMTIEYSDSGGPPYTRHGSGTALRYVVNKGSPLFRAVTNPLHIVALAVADFRAAGLAAGGDEDPAAAQHAIWASIVDGLAGGRERQGRKAAILKGGYGLSENLAGLRSHLEGVYHYRFEFTGLSTLEMYTHNALATPAYSLYTEKGRGEYLRDVVTEHGPEYVPVLDPDGREMDAVYEASRGRHLVVIREYSARELSGPVAPPAKAWMDLVREVRLYHMPYMDEDMVSILDALKHRRMLTARDIDIVARRRKSAHARDLIGQVFGA